jgi:hypothetical protein
VVIRINGYEQLDIQEIYLLVFDIVYFLAAFQNTVLSINLQTATQSIEENVIIWIILSSIPNAHRWILTEDIYPHNL